MIKYCREDSVSVEEFCSVLEASNLGKRRPIGDRERIAAMIKNADLIITAREEGILIGVSRSVTDFVYCNYLSDLAVVISHQKMGIGTELIRRTKMAAPQAKLILLSAPEASTYYPKIGMTQFEQCFYLAEVEDLNNRN